MPAKRKIILVSSAIVLALGGVYALFFDKINRRYKTAKFGLNFLGFEELKGNKGFYSPVLDKYMREVGFKDGYEWCMIFAKMVWFNVHRGKENKKLIQNLITPSTQQTFENFKDATKTKGKFIIATKPKVGDIAIWQSKLNPQKGHAGLVTKVDADAYYTLEGNTNDDGSREGYKIAEKKNSKPRNSLRLRGFLRKK